MVLPWHCYKYRRNYIKLGEIIEIVNTGQRVYKFNIAILHQRRRKLGKARILRNMNRIEAQRTTSRN